MKAILLATAIIAGLAASAAALDENFDNNNAKWSLGKADERKQSLSIEAYNDSMGQVARLSFTPSTFHYLELSAEKPFTLAATEAEFKGVLSLKICSLTPDAITAVSVRVRDASGETFQLMNRLKLRQGEWTTVEIPLDKTTKFNPTWGGNNDKKFDYPLVVQTITMDFDKGFSGQGEAFIDAIKWTPAK